MVTSKRKIESSKALRMISLVILVMLAVTVVAGISTKQAVESRLQEYFGHQADQIAHTFSESVFTSVIMLEGVKGMWDSRGPFDEKIFTTYVNSLNANLERETGASSFFYLQVKPGQAGKTTYPVTYLAPLLGREKALNLDFGTFPERLAAIEYARDNNVLATTKATILTTTDKPGFFFMLPLYKQDAPVERIGQRRENFEGIAGVAFRSEAAFTQIYGIADPYPHLDFQIYQGDSTAPERLLYDHNDKLELENPKFTTKRMVRLSGQTWTVVVETKPSFVLGNTDAKLPFLIFVIGLGLTMIVMLYFLIQLRHWLLGSR